MMSCHLHFCHVFQACRWLVKHSNVQYGTLGTAPSTLLTRYNCSSTTVHLTTGLKIDLFTVDECRMQQCCADHTDIAYNCEQYCSGLLHLIAG
jgi:hypothetical protein